MVAVGGTEVVVTGVLVLCGLGGWNVLVGVGVLDGVGVGVGGNCATHKPPTLKTLPSMQFAWRISSIVLPVANAKLNNVSPG